MTLVTEVKGGKNQATSQKTNTQPQQQQQQQKIINHALPTYLPL